MVVITALKPQKNNKRVNVYVDNAFAFGVDLDSLVRLGLKVGKEFSETEINQIIKEAEFQKVLDKLFRFVTLRPRSEKEVTDYLKRKKVHISLRAGLFDRLKRLELIDDVKFALWWVEQRKTFKPRGRRALAMELMNKGVGKEIIGRVLEQNPINEVRVAKELLDRYSYKWRELDTQMARRKQSEFLLRKGFGWEVVEKITRIDLAD